MPSAVNPYRTSLLHVAFREALEELLVLLQIGVREVLAPLPRLQVDPVHVVERRPVVPHHLLPCKSDSF